ncbi:hypothetical protein CS022_02015 [Veronia nyctiphanis]|uniref:DUF1190 domain-containing protein n=1 Tax=Veronia nyctiphanis TaxID=1278244 RepID=A0A4V1LT94_9GAMM|nr:DUF1190 domain-containing protein [Veronia nyctiphanis]RXJ74408.1 hypothetical protein CS022_02015 [Veronia nyctiphanis]
MKRSTNVIRPRMRKSWAPIYPAVTVAAFTALTGCSEETEQTEIFEAVRDCIDNNPTISAQCHSGYEDALAQASAVAPKFSSYEDCAYEFGLDTCYRDDDNGWFMPVMAGYMFGRLSGSDRYYARPMFSSSYPGSNYYDEWVSDDGYSFGKKKRKSKFNVAKSFLRTKPVTKTKTLSRGGFGSMSASKSSFGKSSSSRSWGG